LRASSAHAPIGNTVAEQAAELLGKGRRGELDDLLARWRRTPRDDYDVAQELVLVKYIGPVNVLQAKKDKKV
jgi:hypothetical protein